MLADHGWKLLPLYRFDPVSGLWRHHAGAPETGPGLSDLLTALLSRPATASESVLAGQLDAAREIIAALEARPPADRLASQVMGEEFERVGWYRPS